LRPLLVALAELHLEFDNGGFELALGADGAGRDGHRRPAAGIVGERHAVEEHRVLVAGRPGDVALDRRRCAGEHTGAERPPPLVLVGWKPRGEALPEDPGRGLHAQQRQRPVVGREHGPIRGEPHQT
jgi:hypothetical protein